MLGHINLYQRSAFCCSIWVQANRDQSMVAHMSFSFTEECFAHLGFLSWTIFFGIFSHWLKKNIVHSESLPLACPKIIQPDEVFRPTTHQVPKFNRKKHQHLLQTYQWSTKTPRHLWLDLFFKEFNNGTCLFEGILAHQQMSGHYKDIQLMEKKTLENTNWSWYFLPFCCAFPEIPAGCLRICFVQQSHHFKLFI